ncbi:MAG: GNAT family N-acetyltransferase, partial [Kiritimatiellia bacterium]
MPATFPAALPVLAAATLHLRALAEADIPDWFARATDADSATLAGDPIPASIAEGPAWLARHRRRFHDRTALRWAIVPGPVAPPGSAASIGTIGLTFPHPGAST